MFAGMNIMVGPDGNVYAAGGFQSSIDLGNSQSISGGADGFVAKFDTAGLCQWKQKIAITAGCGCTNPTNGATLRGFDSQGNLLISGMYCGCGANFGSGITTTDVSNTMYIAKYNPLGQCLWAKTKPSTINDAIVDITTDAQDNIYISIYNYAMGVTFCGLTFPNQANYIAKINSNGVSIWSFSTGTSYEITNMTFYKNRLYCAGLFAGTSTLGTNTYTANGSGDGFILAMDTSGAILRSTIITGPGIETPTSMCYASNKICLLSQASPSVAVGTYTINTGSGMDITFLVSFDTSLNVINARNTANDNKGSGASLTADKFGGIYVLVNNSATTGFGNLLNVPADRHVIKMDANLNNFWYKESVGGIGGGSVAPDTLGNIYIIDNFNNSANYGPLSNTATGFGITLGKIQRTLTPIGGPAGRQNNNMSVYPNPSAGLFNLKLTNAIKNNNSIKIILYDINGKMLDNIPFTKNDETTLQINLSAYAQGNYIIKAEVDGILYSAKLER